MRRVALLVLSCAVLQLGAKDVTISLDSAAKGRGFRSGAAMRIGYAADPAAGGEDAALAYRRAGAWSFLSSKCDDETLKFLAKYGLRVFLRVDGEAKEMIETLNRIGKGPYAEVVMGVQLGTDPTGGADALKWRTAASVAARNFPGRPVALPVKDADSEILAKLKGQMRGVTHVMVDLRDTPAPYGKLDALARALRKSSDASTRALRLWAVAPGRLADQADASSPATLAWQMHWMMSALAVDATDGVFFERPCRKDDFGLMMRHLWATLALHPTLIAHGEGASAAPPPAEKKSGPTAEIGLDDDFSDVGEVLSDTFSGGAAPVACANVAEGRTGDLEYLAFIEKAGEPEDTQICLVLVNTSAERVQATVRLKSKSGMTGPGFRRSLKPDGKAGGMSNLTTERRHAPPAPTVEWIEPGEITFLDFRI